MEIHKYKPKMLKTNYLKDSPILCYLELFMVKIIQDFSFIINFFPFLNVLEDVKIPKHKEIQFILSF